MPNTTYFNRFLSFSFFFFFKPTDFLFQCALCRFSICCLIQTHLLFIRGPRFMAESLLRGIFHLRRKTRGSADSPGVFFTHIRGYNSVDHGNIKKDRIRLVTLQSKGKTCSQKRPSVRQGAQVVTTGLYREDTLTVEIYSRSEFTQHGGTSNKMLCVRITCVLN